MAGKATAQFANLIGRTSQVSQIGSQTALGGGILGAIASRFSGSQEEEKKVPINQEPLGRRVGRIGNMGQVDERPGQVIAGQYQLQQILQPDSPPLSELNIEELNRDIQGALRQRRDQQELLSSGAYFVGERDFRGRETRTSVARLRAKSQGPRGIGRQGEQQLIAVHTRAVMDSLNLPSEYQAFMRQTVEQTGVALELVADQALRMTDIQEMQSRMETEKEQLRRQRFEAQRQQIQRAIQESDPLNVQNDETAINILTRTALIMQGLSEQQDVQVLIQILQNYAEGQLIEASVFERLRDQATQLTREQAQSVAIQINQISEEQKQVVEDEYEQLDRSIDEESLRPLVQQEEQKEIPIEEEEKQPLLQEEQPIRIAQPVQPQIMRRPGRLEMLRVGGSLLTRGIMRPDRPASWEEVRSALETGFYQIDQRWLQTLNVTPENAAWGLDVLTVLICARNRPTILQLTGWIRTGTFFASVCNYLRSPFNIVVTGYIIYRELISERDLGGDKGDFGSQYDAGSTSLTDEEKKNNKKFIQTIKIKDLSDNFPQCKRRWYRKEDGTLTSIVECITYIDGIPYKRHYQGA